MIDLLAQVPGVVVLGDQSVAGHNGLLLNTELLKTLGGPDRVVIDKKTGEVVFVSVLNPEPLPGAQPTTADVPPVPAGTATLTFTVIS